MTQQHHSLWAQHQRILGYSDAPLPSDQEEAQRIERLRLPPLTLPLRQSNRLWRMPRVAAWGTGLALVVAALAMMMIVQPTNETNDIRIKGAHHVSVFWERSGEVKPWTPETPLQEGDRIRAEVLAATPVTAYVAVASREGKLLLAPERVLASGQTLDAGERKAFSGSFKLTGPAEGETLVVILCSGGSLTNQLLEQSRQSAQLLGKNQLPKGCDAQLFPLR